MIEIKKLQIPTLPTKKPRRLYIYLPRDYAVSGLSYPVMYMFDGHNVFYDSHATYGKSWGMREYLARTRLPLIIAAIECNHEGDRRLNEYAPWDVKIPKGQILEGRGELTMEWLAGPLKQMIDSEYRTLPDRENTLIGGSSMGGLMALYAVTAYNEVYSRAAALSPSLWAGGKDLRSLISGTSLAQPTRVYMDVGSCEGRPGRFNHLSGMFDCAAKLTKAGAHVAARVVPGAYHCEAAWEKRIPVFMDYLLGDEEQ